MIQGSFRMMSIKPTLRRLMSTAITETTPKIATTITTTKTSRTGAFKSQIPHPLYQFFETFTHSVPPQTMDENRYVYGRAWTADELRRKSWNDLHTLWYVLLKERNILATQKQEFKRNDINKDTANNPQRQRTCRLSMSRIKLVLRERQLAFEELQKKYQKQQNNIKELNESIGEKNILMEQEPSSQKPLESLIDSESQSTISEKIVTPVYKS